MKKVLAIALALAAGNAFAAIGSTPFTVTARVNATCDIVVPTLDFGAYDVVTNGIQNGQVDITLHCTKGATPRVALSAGIANSFAPRHMTGTGTNGDVLTYNLFSDAARSTVWTTTPVTAASASSSRSTAITMTIYGQILANQDVAADTYSDSITATVSF